MKPLLLLSLGAMVLVAVPAAGPFPPASAASPHPKVGHAPVAGLQTVTHGTVVALSTRGATGTVLVRGSGHGTGAIEIGSRSRISTLDGRALALTDVRLGDYLAVSTDGHVQDYSQRAVNMHGIVSAASASTGDPIVVQAQSTSIVVDTRAATPYTDRSHETTGVAQLQEGDAVQFHGVLDVVLGEITRTDSIARLGPFRSTHRSVARVVAP